MNGRQILADGAFGCRARVLSFPPSGNVFNKPLDSGLRRNDSEGNRHLLILPLTIATQQRDSCLPAAGTSENNLNIQESV